MDGNTNGFNQSGQTGSLHLNPAAEAGLTEEQMETPQNAQEYYLDSLSAILRANVGQPVSCEFLIGTNNIVRREGFLYSSGVNYMTLYQPNENRYMVCDIYSLKFVSFYDLRGRQATAMRNMNDLPWMSNNQPNLQNGPARNENMQGFQGQSGMRGNRGGY
ncbi:MAG TPA: hypothetical protein IAD07_05695 [Candidatus Fimivicinus intestinavium]|nr:hypothetical protein [Candidatus Fimivicinus intestinavium]